MARRHKRNSRHAVRNGQAATIRALEDLARVERRRAAEAARRLERASLADRAPERSSL
jgi:hypothetical protein